MSLFSGMDRAHGVYKVEEVREDDQKKIGPAATKREPVTIELWKKHLSGEQGLGIIPIRDDSTCSFGAVDVDSYKENLAALATKIKILGLPVVVCRSKSGGAHLYAFSKEPVPAAQMQSKLKEIAAYIGHGGCEVFPKQVKILSEHGDVGQWINMPYFNGLKGGRYGILPSGDAMAPSDFLDLCESIKIDQEFFDRILINQDKMKEGPPCLQALVQLGFPVGVRNNGLFNLGVFLRKAHPDSWKQEIESHNHRFMNPPLESHEVQGITKSLTRKSYEYTCSTAPIAQHCNAAVCRTRKYGIGGAGSGRFPIIGGLTKLMTDPPIWFLEVDSQRMELSTEDLQDPRKFQKKCMESLNQMPTLPGKPAWESMIQQALDSVTMISAPKDSTPEGQFLEHLSRFCNGKAQGTSLEDILLRKPYQEDGHTFFRMVDLLEFLSRNKFYEIKQNKIASILRDLGADHQTKKLKGRCVNYWIIPTPDYQDEPLNVPQSIHQDQPPF